MKGYYRIVFLSHIDINLYLFRLPIMKALIEKGWDVYALVPKGEYSEKLKKYEIKHVDYKIERKSLNPLKEIRTIINIKEKLEEIRPEILHTFTVKPNVYGTIAGKLANVPIVINTITGLGSFFIENDLKAKIVRSIILNLYKITFNFSNAVIFQNQDDLKFFVQNKIISENKVYLIKGSGIDISLWKPKNKKGRDVIKIISIGRLLKHKGMEEFIKIAEVLKNKYKDKVEFIIIGDFYDGNPYSIDRNLLSYAIENKIVSHYNWLPVEEVKNILADSDIFVLLSYREGLPRTGIEALSLGLPIITSSTIGCKEIVENGKNGFLVDYKNIDDIINKIEILINNPTLRRKMGSESRKKAEKEFSLQRVIEEYIHIYNDLLAKRKISKCK